MQLRQQFLDSLELRAVSITNLEAPSLAERENLWRLTVETYQAAQMDGHKAGMVRKELAAWLWWHVPAMGKSQAAIFRQILRKSECFTATGCLADKRREAAQKKCAPKLSKQDRDVLVNIAIHQADGFVDFGWQICLAKKLLSGEVLKRYPVPKSGRPRCPKNIRQQVAAEIAALYQHRVRPHWNSNNVSPMIRDWSAVFAQDIFESDDKTLDVLCRVTEDEKGQVVERVIRCQFLPMIDVKSGKILDFVLIGEPNYNSISIRTLITRVCKKYGLPGSFSFERGIWKTGKLLGNSARGKPFAEVENFASRLGCPIRHALPGRARTKIVETVFRLLDRKMYGWPGYIGNDEMHKKFECARTDGLWTFDELYSHLVAAVEDYNTTKSESAVKGGWFTPDEIWKSCRRCAEDGTVLPATKLPPEFEYLLTDHCVEVMVREYGIKTQIGAERFQFFSPELVDFTTALLGQTVKLSFDPGNPETAIVTDLKEERFISVQRVSASPARANSPADWEMFAEASAPHRTYTRQVRQRFSDLKATYVHPFRATIADAITRVRAQARSDAKVKGEQQFTVKNKSDRAASYAKRGLEAKIQMWKFYDYEVLHWFEMGLGGPPKPPDFPRPKSEPEEDCAIAPARAPVSDLGTKDDCNRYNSAAALAGFMQETQ